MKIDFYLRTKTRRIHVQISPLSWVLNPFKEWPVKENAVYKKWIIGWLCLALKIEERHKNEG
jgi:hypothetical protein